MHLLYRDDNGNKCKDIHILVVSAVAAAAAAKGALQEKVQLSTSFT